MISVHNRTDSNDAEPTGQKILRFNPPFPAQNMLPHGPPFTLIDFISERWEDGGKTSSVVRTDNPLVNQFNAVGEEILIEYAAQTCAVLDSLQHEGQISPGLLVEAVDSQFIKYPHIGDTIEVEIRIRYDLGKWRGVSFRILINDVFAAEGVLKLCILSDS